MGVVVEKKKWTLTQDAFDKLLDWLDPERERAGEIYEEIRQRLIEIFICRGCDRSEELADESMNRVIKGIDEIAPGYHGDPRLYFYGVAQNVYKEYLRRKSKSLPLLLPPDPPGDAERLHACLERCLQRLTDEEREMILQYYKEEKQSKIVLRGEIAQRLKISPDTMRKRVQRIRNQLKFCISNCIKRMEKP